MTAVVFEATFVVLTENVPELFPARIVTELGTGAEVELLDKLIERPLAGATPLILTVAVDAAPPLTEVGLRVIDTMTGAVMLSVPETLFVP
jgi:hypothetical protein